MFLRRSDSTPTRMPLSSQGWYWWFRSLKKLSLLCFFITYYRQMVSNTQFLFIFCFQLFFLQNFFSYCHSQYCLRFFFSMFLLPSKANPLICSTSPCSFRMPVLHYILYHASTLLRCYYNLILLLCSPVLHLDTVFLLQFANVLGQNLKLAYKKGNAKQEKQKLTRV